VRSLFARIFVAFAVVSVGATLAVSAIFDAQIERRQTQRLGLIADSMLLHGEEAAEALRAGDRARAEQTLAQLRSRIDLRIAIVDDGEIVLTSGDVPDGIERLAEQATSSPSHRLVADETWMSARAHQLPGIVIVGAIAEPRERWGALRFSPQSIRVVLLLLATALASFLLARALTRPIRTLRAATQKIAEGDTSVRVATAVGRADDEVRGLAADFDRMTERIESLLAARERLLRDVSHELRSPLARLQVALGIARQRAGEPAQPVLDRIEREAERLSELIGLVLTMARLENAREVEPGEEIALDELVLSVSDDARFEAESESRSVSVGETDPVRVRGSEEILRQAIENVMRNAVRFTAEGTSVEVRLVREGDEAVITVRDRGPGVPEEALEEIFRPFTRLEAARDRASGGAGIGLAITERAVHLHRGTVRASNAEGGGLEVRMRLPLA
jgi:two-component system, OmpR family, sensor kinase